MYILGDYIKCHQTMTLPSSLNILSRRGANILINSCSDIQYQYLYNALDTTGKTIFKSLHSCFVTYHKFNGQV